MTERKIRLDLAVTLDGFIEGPNGEIDWCIMEEEMNFDGFLDQIDTIFFGRKSYDLWVKDTNEFPDKEKIVFSRTQIGPNYVNGEIAEAVAAIKKQTGKDIWLYGGAELITTFVNLGLVDEYRLSVHPIILGAGKPLFENIANRVPLKLIETNSYPSGVVQLIYTKE